ncbi:MAG: tryptophan synthase subunit alpha [Acidimicrobiales bacterium]
MNTFTGTLEGRLRERRAAGHKLLVPYITGGYPVDDWTRLIEGMADAGADAIEIGVPFSDPVMDGPTIQESSALALELGATPASVLAGVATVDAGIPMAVMTYYNIAFHMGHHRFAASLKEAGVSAAILPDLPLEESDDWCRDAAEAGIETVMLAAPTGDDARLARVCERSTGFVYGVGLVGITGERAELADSATKMAMRLKATTDKPVLIGIGVSNAAQAAEVCEVADGVVVGSAVIRRILDTGRVDAAIEFVAELRAGLDAG